MSLESKESSTNDIINRAKGTNLYFSLREFTVVIGLNCLSNKDDFIFDEDLPNKIIDQYFDGARYIQKRELFAAVTVESGRYRDYPWGSVAYEELAKSLNTKLKPTEKFYMLYGMPLAIQIWFYEYCSDVPCTVASKVVFKNIEPTRKEISSFQIPEKVVPRGGSHKEAFVDSDDDFQDPPL
ncbi:hypothetical protein BC332_23191 [Capsicum chinense]|nr:hypothetical protein BC332_23191 [Capsicum chinense]